MLPHGDLASGYILHSGEDDRHRMRKLPPLNALRAFEAAARHMSFTQAARELHVTATAVSHQIRHLEEVFGLFLFTRSPRGLRLTDAGEHLYPVLRDGFDRFAVVVQDLACKPAGRGITVSTTLAFAERWLIPRLPSFQSAQPGIEIRVNADDRVVDLRSGDIDAAIRYGRGPYPGLRSEVLLEDAFVPVCSPSLVSRNFEPLRVSNDLARHSFIHYEWKNPAVAGPSWSDWMDLTGTRGTDTTRGVRFSEEAHAIQAAVGGQGVALCSAVLVADELAAGRLVQPFGPLIKGLAFHLLYLDTSPRRASVDAFSEWLRSITGQQAVSGTMIAPQRQIALE